jgi:hypothetical protein
MNILDTVSNDDSGLGAVRSTVSFCLSVETAYLLGTPKSPFSRNTEEMTSYDLHQTCSHKYKPKDSYHNSIYIYIYRERERERER